jgi:uncharacterized protein (DUF1778 family)
MQRSGDTIRNSHDRTALEPVDHDPFFSALDFPPAPTDALRAAFRRSDETTRRVKATQSDRD